MPKPTRQIEQAYRLARERYARAGVDTGRAMARLRRMAISIHCWQGDDVGGFEVGGGGPGGGMTATGNYPGKARTPDELRSDFLMATSLVPGRHRLSLHASYGEFGSKRVDRNEIGPEHFAGWIDWAKANRIGLDFNVTCFSHPKAADGFTLSHQDKGIRKFWIEHCIACRRIGATMGRKLGSACQNNVWIPDGYKDTPADRLAPRERLIESLDAVFKAKYSKSDLLDSVEPKLFGIGSESYVTGSHEFYLGYAVTRQVLLTLDSGHYHPTESIADKISSVLLYLPQIGLHVSRGIHWDSDHVVTLSDDLQNIAQEVVWGGQAHRVRIALDYFDASINRVAAWVIGTRNMLRALLLALLAPTERLKRFEREGDFTSRLAVMEEVKTLPFGAVWDHYCAAAGVPVGESWLAEVKKYEREVLLKRK